MKVSLGTHLGPRSPNFLFTLYVPTSNCTPKNWQKGWFFTTCMYLLCIAVQKITLKVSLTLYQVLQVRNPRQLSWAILAQGSSGGCGHLKA